MRQRCQLLAFCQRQIHAVRRPFKIIRKPGRTFPSEVKTLGVAIRVARRNKSIVQPQLAAILNVPLNHIEEWEHDRRIPPAATLEKISKVLCLPDWFKTNNPNS